MTKIITTEQVAAMLSTPGKAVTVRRVQQLAKEMNLPRLGRMFLITERDVREMRARKTKRGPAKRSKG